MVKQIGSIHIISLLFLSVMFCMFTVFTETNIFQIRQFSSAQRQFFMLSMAEDKLTELEKKIVEHAFTTFTNSTEKVNDLNISYFVEFLGEYDCVVIEDRTANFFRAHVMIENVLHEKLHLASTVAYPSEQQSSCKVDQQLISAGRQSWYQFE